MYLAPHIIDRWLPVIIDRLTIEDALANRRLYPETIPDTVRELLIEQARRIESVRQTHDAKVQSTLEVPESLSEIAVDQIDLLWLAVNGFEPDGVVTVYNQSSAIGVIAAFYKDDQTKLAIHIDQGTTEPIRINVAPQMLHLILPQVIGDDRAILVQVHQETLSQFTVPSALPVVFDTRSRPLLANIPQDAIRKYLIKWRRALGLVVRQRSL